MDAIDGVEYPDSKESIFSSAPGEEGGRIARQGFEYQDHIGVRICLEMMKHPELSEVWIEYIDDIVAIRHINSIPFIEMIQVKTDDPDQRWTVAYLLRRESGKKGTSIPERFLLRAKYEEKTYFRLVINHDIVKELGPLSSPLINYSRRESCQDIDDIIAKAEEKLGQVTSKAGLTLKDLFYTLHVDKCEGTTSSVEACNIRSFNKILVTRKHHLFYDQCEEICRNLLVYVRNVSIEPTSNGGEKHKIKKDQLEKWLSRHINDFDVGVGSEKMVQKMREANIPDDAIEGAKTLRERFVSERLSADYSNGSILGRIEASVIAALQCERAKLDSGEITETGIQFHSRCLAILKDVSLSREWGDDKPPLDLFLGCMYNLTNRNLHRFKAAES